MSKDEERSKRIDKLVKDVDAFIAENKKLYTKPRVRVKAGNKPVPKERFSKPVKSFESIDGSGSGLDADTVKSSKPKWRSFVRFHTKQQAADYINSNDIRKFEVVHLFNEDLYEVRW